MNSAMNSRKKAGTAPAGRDASAIIRKRRPAPLSPANHQEIKSPAYGQGKKKSPGDFAPGDSFQSGEGSGSGLILIHVLFLKDLLG